MNRKDLMMSRMAAILCTLEETNGAIESMLCIFCEMNMDDYSIIRDIFLDAGLVTIKSHYVTLTPKGIDMAKKINEVIKSKSS